MGKSEPNYSELGLKVGLEIHQQLDTRHKLFCNCPTTLAPEDTPKTEVVRYLRVAKSEVGEIDPAALYEMRKGRRIVYEFPEGHACMVELDEEPPHELNREAVTIALAIAKALHSKPVDEVYVMRKIVIDGSNTTGFQRTAIIALGGYVEDEEGRVGIQTVCVEEDAARKVGEGKGFVKYNLDRLGIPLIEIATAPDIRTPQQAMRVAFKIGLLMRLTGRVKRGLGTIRQDLNVSIARGVKTEIKGVSKLELIPKIIEYEVMRQLRLIEISEELKSRGVNDDMLKYEVRDLTHVFSNCKSKLIRRALRKGQRVLATPLPGFAGLLGKEVQPSRRFGTELSDYAKAWGGVGGIIHSDELPAYGISDELKMRVYRELGLDPSRDAYVLVVSDRERGERALHAVVDRARQAIHGIPKETRGANPDGTTRYLRPQPGAARMYPETDVPPLRLSERILAEAESLKPKQPEEVLQELIEEHGVSPELAKQLVRDPMLFTYLDLVRELRDVVEPKLVASTLLIHLKGLKSEGVDPSAVTEEVLEKVLRSVGEGLVAKEAIPDILLEYVRRGEDIEDVISRFKGLSTSELESLIDKILNENSDLIRSRGDRAFGLIMGKVMAVVRGRVDGKVVAETVRQRLKEFLKQE